MRSCTIRHFQERSTHATRQAGGKHNATYKKQIISGTFWFLFIFFILPCFVYRYRRSAFTRTSLCFVTPLCMQNTISLGHNTITAASNTLSLWKLYLLPSLWNHLTAYDKILWSLLPTSGLHSNQTVYIINKQPYWEKKSRKTTNI